mgnify:CR=1 FL=1
MDWQRDAIAVIKSTTGPLNFGFKPSAALVAIDPRNGYIRTMVGGLDYKKQKFNLAWQAKRQAGSSMKPFVLTTAIEQGMNPDSTYYSSKSPIVIPMGAYAAPWVVNGDGPGGAGPPPLLPRWVRRPPSPGPLSRSSPAAAARSRAIPSRGATTSW